MVTQPDEQYWNRTPREPRERHRHADAAAVLSYKGHRAPAAPGAHPPNLDQRRQHVDERAVVEPGRPPEPPPEATESAMVMGAPPPARTFLSCPSATKAIHAPSGENTGLVARSVPGIGIGRNSRAA